MRLTETASKVLPSDGFHFGVDPELLARQFDDLAAAIRLGGEQPGGVIVQNHVVAAEAKVDDFETVTISVTFARRRDAR